MNYDITTLLAAENSIRDLVQTEPEKARGETDPVRHRRSPIT